MGVVIRVAFSAHANQKSVSAHTSPRHTAHRKRLLSSGGTVCQLDAVLTSVGAVDLGSRAASCRADRWMVRLASGTGMARRVGCR